MKFPQLNLKYQQRTHTQTSTTTILTASFKKLHEYAVTIANEISCHRCNHTPTSPHKKKGNEEKEEGPEDILSKCSIFMLE
jgi:hypothetical protein